MASAQTVRDVRDKVQRILTRNHNNVRVDEDGDFMIRHNSANVWVEIQDGFGDEGVIVAIRCPMINKVSLTPELLRWVALEGHKFRIGTVCAYEDKDTPGTGSLFFEHNIIGDDIDESEVMGSVYPVAITGDQLDTELHSRFGGEMFGRD